MTAANKRSVRTPPVAARNVTFPRQKQKDFARCGFCSLKLVGWTDLTSEGADCVGFPPNLCLERNSCRLQKRFPKISRADRCVRWGHTGGIEMGRGRCPSCYSWLNPSGFGFHDLGKKTQTLPIYSIEISYNFHVVIYSPERSCW